MADALERGHDEDDLALMFGVSVQTVRATLSLLDATRAVRDAVESGTVTVTRRVSWHRLNQKISGRRSLKSKRQLLEQPAMKSPASASDPRRGKAAPENPQRNHQSPESAEGEYASALRWVLGGGMNIDPENYSKYTLRRFAALFDVICWVLIAVVTVGICMFIEWVTA